jgi:hypothetical protein
MYKIKHNLVRCDFSLQTNEMVVNRQTRQSKQLRLPRYTTAKSQSSIFYRGMRLYNQFSVAKDSDLKITKSLAQVKVLIKEFSFAL